MLDSTEAIEVARSPNGCDDIVPVRGPGETVLDRTEGTPPRDVDPHRVRWGRCALDDQRAIFEHPARPTTFTDADWRALKAIARGDRS